MGKVIPLARRRKRPDGLDAKRWRHVRRAALDRDGWRCVQCGRAGRLEVDHILRQRDGGALYELANLQSLCRECHFAKTAKENKRPGGALAQAWAALVDELQAK